MSKLAPKILIACPTSDRHKHLLNKWIRHLNSLAYPSFDLIMIDTSEKDDYFNLLKKQKVKGKNIILERMPWDSDKNHILQHLAHVRNRIREYFLENDYDSIFFLDDDIFIPKNGVQRLLSYDKDCVGFYVHIFDKEHQQPCIFKTGELIFGTGIDLYSFEEINQYKKFVKKYNKGNLSPKDKNLSSFLIEDQFRPQLLHVHATGIGCLMIKRKVMEEVPFRTHDKVILGEDIWFFNEANDKKFKFYVDTNVRAKHLNTNWDIINKKCENNFKMYLAHGPVDAKGIDIIDRSKK